MGLIRRVPFTNHQCDFIHESFQRPSHLLYLSINPAESRLFSRRDTFRRRQLPLSGNVESDITASRAHVEISTPSDISTRDLRHQGVSSKIFGDSELKSCFFSVCYRQHPILRPLVQLLPLSHPVRRILWRTNMKEKIASPLASSSGTVSLGGELTVRRLGFGAMRITGDGIWGPPRDPASALAVLRLATELGVNFIDTADSYGPYVSEELIAKALAPYPKDLVIATKGGWNRPGPDQWT